ncbi:MAG: formate dehydrogenase accessory sulfurtransferase FdhD [Spirochaetaceae bacterium]
MDIYETKSIIKVLGNSKEILDDVVVTEYPLTIYLNKNEFVTILCTPKSLKELTIGFLIGEGIIENLSDISNIDLHLDRNISCVTLSDNINIENTLSKKDIRTTGCGRGSTFNLSINELSKHKLELSDDLVIKTSDIISNMNTFVKKSDLFRLTGGVHSVMLSDNNKELFFEDDIGRHNAVDKIIGNALIQKISLNSNILFTSGRISSEIIMKIAKAGLPVIISKSAPTSVAIELAEHLNITLIGFARGKRMNIYTHPQRVLVE